MIVQRVEGRRKNEAIDSWGGALCQELGALPEIGEVTGRAMGALTEDVQPRQVSLQAEQVSAASFPFRSAEGKSGSDSGDGEAGRCGFGKKYSATLSRAEGFLGGARNAIEKRFSADGEEGVTTMAGRGDFSATVDIERCAGAGVKV